MARSSVDPGLVPLDGIRRTEPSREGARHFMRTGGKPTADWFSIKNETDDEPAKVYIYDEIGMWGTDARSFVKELTAIDNSEIHVHINSPGGEIFDGIAIYNALLAHKATVTVYVDSLAASAASFIAQAGDKVFMSENATMMIHDGSGICFGDAKDMQDMADILNKMSNNIASIYAKRAGEDETFWRALMQEEVWYNAEEAVTAGLADKVIDASDAKAKNTWDFSIFDHAGRDEAPAPEKIRQLVFNRVKEAPVSDAPKTPATVVMTGGGSTPPTPTPPAPPTPTSPPPVTEVKSFVLKIDGKEISDVAAVQAHIDSLNASNTALQAAAKEQQVENRKAFIKSLCDGKKILASQVDELEKFVLGDDDEPALTDKQYAKWVASWNAASVLGVLNSGVTEGVTNPDGTPTDAATQAAQKVEDDLDIVRMHKRANMPKDRLEATPSYMRLAAANALARI